MTEVEDQPTDPAATRTFLFAPQLLRRSHRPRDICRMTLGVLRIFSVSNPPFAPSITVRWRMRVPGHDPDLCESFQDPRSTSSSDDTSNVAASEATSVFEESIQDGA